jgi:hypothetical protein
MDDSAISNTPAAIPTILSETRALGFDMISEPRVGSLLGGMDALATLDWPGKFSYLDKALALLHPGGLYVIDDLQPQPNWPEGHAPKVPALMSDLERRTGSPRSEWRGHPD